MLFVSVLKVPCCSLDKFFVNAVVLLFIKFLIDVLLFLMLLSSVVLNLFIKKIKNFHFQNHQLSR